MSTVKLVAPIKPNEIIENLDKIIPQVVVQAVNELLKEQYRGKEVTIKQKDIISKIQSLDSSLTSDILINKKYLDFEKLYRDNGWVVSYDSPGFNESYEATFSFKEKK